MTNTVKQVQINNSKKAAKKNGEESFYTNFVTFFDAASNTFGLFMKNHFRGSTFYLANILIPILVTFGVCGFITLTGGIDMILFISLTFAGLATYGTLIFTIRRSTIIKNISMTSNETGSLYFASFFTILISIFITLFVVILTAYILDEIGYIEHVMKYVSEENIALGTWYTDYTQIWWGMLIYYACIQACLCFALAFFIEKVASTQRNFFLIVMIYIVAGIFFSGIFSGTMYVDENGVVSLASATTTQEELQGVSVLPPYLWGEPFWIAGQLFPHYGANQLVWNSFAGGAYHTIDGVTTYNNWHSINLFYTDLTTSVSLYFIAPWLWVVLLLYMASMMERFKEKGSK